MVSLIWIFGTAFWSPFSFIIQAVLFNLPLSPDHIISPLRPQTAANCEVGIGRFISKRLSFQNYLNYHTLFFPQASVSIAIAK